MPITGGSRVPAGVVDYFAAGSVPAGYLECNGAAISRTVYAALFAVIGTTYGAGDGATTFKIPDCRGEFIRALDSGRGVDAGRAIGTAQGGTVISNKINAAGAIIVSGTDSLTASSQTAINGTGVGGGSSDFTVRPRNVAMLACIKF